MSTRRQKGTRGFINVWNLESLKEALISLITLLVKYSKGCIHSGLLSEAAFDICCQSIPFALVFIRHRKNVIKIQQVISTSASQRKYIIVLVDDEDIVFHKFT